MSPLSALFLRHESRLLDSPPDLWFNPPGDLPAHLVTDDGHTRCVTQDEATRRRLVSRNMRARLAAFPSVEAPTKLAVYGLPREKARLRMGTHALASCLAGDGMVLAAG